MIRELVAQKPEDKEWIALNHTQLIRALEEINTSLPGMYDLKGHMSFYCGPKSNEENVINMNYDFTCCSWWITINAGERTVCLTDGNQRVQFSEKYVDKAMLSVTRDKWVDIHLEFLNGMNLTICLQPQYRMAVDNWWTITPTEAITA